MFQIYLYIISIAADHKFEKGFVNHFSYFVNNNLVLYTSLTKFRYEELYIPFQKQFALVPDVYLNLALLDIGYQFPQGYSLVITSITTAGFKVKIVCETINQFYAVEFNWFAFNDERVQVINNFNITNPQTQYTHAYQKNCQINMALSNFLSYYALGSQYNYLTGLTLTPETVTISFSFQGLKQFGYQIILSSSDIFLIGPTIISIQPSGSTQVVNFPTGWTIQNCYLNLLGFKYDGIDFNFRLSTKTTYSSQVTVEIYTWSSTIFTSMQFNHFCINHAFFELAQFNGLMQSTFFDPNNQIDTHIEIKEINYSQNQIISEEITIAQSIGSITIIFYWQCIDQEMLMIQLLCPEQWCSQTNIKCDINKIHTVRLQAKFLLDQNQQQYIKIAKTSVSLSATQVIKLTNQYEKTLFKLEIV
ncbi:unnamed protein product [Paramecium pentaurelia]|uniref:H-type lectin domain-containing protein n=1 Tax=Paramecium pentaurelia TaxID=43138 RepID=A0A8S1YAA6_9CILI|nr:unnamed protein product [Paramecium pentaurelia]